MSCNITIQTNTVITYNSCVMLCGTGANYNPKMEYAWINAGCESGMLVVIWVWM